jgi:predicted Zn-dependent peptidase
MYRPQGAALIVAGRVAAGDIGQLARQAFGEWTGARPMALPPAGPGGIDGPDPAIVLVDRPRASQSEVRIGHLGPPRRTDAYHALVTANALVGGQYTSRINRKLREEKGVTYGARSTFDFRRQAGMFSCAAGVQADSTAEAVGDIIDTLADVRREGSVGRDELERAKASLTRGYVRHFETPGQIARAAVQLVTHGLDDDTFDHFVPSVNRVTAADVQAVADRHIRPEDATVVVVGDADSCRASLESLGRRIETYTPEF